MADQHPSVPFKIPPGGLLGRPLQGKHKLTIKPGKVGDIGAVRVSDILTTKEANEPTLRDVSAYDGIKRDIQVPEGSLKAYFANHAQEYNQTDAHAIMTFEYEPVPGEDLRIPRDKIPPEVRKAIEAQASQAKNDPPPESSTASCTNIEPV